VKRYKNGFITKPLCLAPWNTIRDVLESKTKYGFGGFPITEDGSLGSRLVGPYPMFAVGGGWLQVSVGSAGIVTDRDVDFREDLDTLVSDVMSTDLVVAEEPCTLAEANLILRESKKGYAFVCCACGRWQHLFTSRTDSTTASCPL
jgi:IMP dehydrogenase